MRRDYSGRLVHNTNEPLPVGTREERADDLIYRAIAVFYPNLTVDDKLALLDQLKFVLGRFKGSSSDRKGTQRPY